MPELTADQKFNGYVALIRVLAHEKGAFIRRTASNTRLYRKGYYWQALGRRDIGYTGRINIVAPDIATLGRLLATLPWLPTERDTRGY